MITSSCSLEYSAQPSSIASFIRIVVFGANGPTGRRLTGQVLAAGHDVVAVTRRPDTFPHRHERLTVVGADVHDAEGVPAGSLAGVKWAAASGQ